MTAEISFTDVGRNKVSWKEEFLLINGVFHPAAVIAMIKKKKCLASREISITYLLEESRNLITGEVFVGESRKVGRFEITLKTAQ